MSENLEKFKRLVEFTRSGGPHEATFGVMEDLAKKDVEVLSWVAKEFHATDDPIMKSDLARIAVVAGERGEFEKFLRDFEQWEDADFTSL